MATVQVNDKLKERTEQCVDRFKRQALERYDEAFRRILPHSGDDLYRNLVGEEYLAWVKQAPVGMFDLVDKLKIAAMGGNEIGMDLPLDTKVPTPAKQTMFAGGAIESGFKCLTVNLNENYPAWQPYKEPAEVLHRRRTNLTENTRELKQFTRKLYREHASLGPVLRMWPPLWDLLHEDDRRRQGAKPYGARIPIPSYIGDEEYVMKMTALVMRIKMETR